MRLLLAAALLVACSSPPAPAPPGPPPPPPAADAPAASADAATPALVADGGTCTSGAQCASGVCEGDGCTDDKPGTCKPASRACTKDLREYCGCDGAIFRGSGSCPLRRHQAMTACAPAAPALKADGASCLAAGECASGVCEGQGCSDDKPGTCAAAQRGCTRDLRAYCGCDGKTFKASGSCPRQRYEAKGACPKGT